MLLVAAAIQLGMGAAPAAAAGRAATALACTDDGGAAVTIAAVNQDFSLALTDGRNVRLLGVDPVHDTAGRPAAAAEARAKLSDWLAGRPAMLQAGAATDRWGRVPGLMFAATKPEEQPRLSVSVAMADAGLARARFEPEARSCWPALLAAEAAARAAGLGLWNDPYYAIRPAGDAASLTDVAGGMVLAEGRVTHVGESRTHVFLDFGPAHRALAVQWDKRDAFIHGQGGTSHEGWVGRTLRIRGTLEDRGGPRIDVHDAAQVEDLTSGAAGAAP